MRVHCGLPKDWSKIPEGVKRAEAAGFDGVNAAEVSHNPFLALMLAAEHSKRVTLETSIALAFSRNPMDMAYIVHDVNAYSKGRFIVGMGSQVKGHIERRFSMPWSAPAARMREFVQAMKAIWDDWYDGKQLRFEGEFYRHSLMTPMFRPLNTEHGRPRIHVAAVGPLMTAVAAEECDGIILHGFTTERYIKEVTMPIVEKGLAKAGRRREDFEVGYGGFTATGRTEEEFQAARTGVCKQIAFYASTPSYRPVLELHGWGELQTELNALTKKGRWDEMGGLIDDDIFQAFTRVGSPRECVQQFTRSFAGVIDRTRLDLDVAEDERAELLAELQAA